MFRPGLGDTTGREIRQPGGWLEYRFAPGDLVEIVNIEVDSDKRGRGIGASLVKKLESLSEQPVAFYGFVRCNNSSAVAFYKAIGCTLTKIPGYYAHRQHAFLFYKRINEQLSGT